MWIKQKERKLMKLRKDLVTNSSSTSYIITNKTNKDKTLVDFIEENKSWILVYLKDYEGIDIKDKKSVKIIMDELIASAKYTKIAFPKKKSIECELSDDSCDDGDKIGRVFRTVIREGSSESFRWRIAPDEVKTRLDY